MKRDDALNLLRQHESELHNLGVAHAYLFGSVARDEAGADSDVDMLVTPATPHFSLLNLIRVRRFLGTVFASDADVFTTNGTIISHPFRENVKSDMIEAC